MTTDFEPVKLTKKLQALFDKYGTTIRHTDSLVEHELTKKQTLVPPVAFAVFETAMKAVYSSNMTSDQKWRDQFETSGHAAWYIYLATKNGFSLPSMSNTFDTHLAAKYAEDYEYCGRLIANAGLYYALLD